MTRQFPLIEYNIEGIGIHCTIDIFVANIKIGTLDTGTKYEDSAEEELAEYIKSKLFNDLEIDEE